METNQMISLQLNRFLENKQREILSLVHKTTNEIVKTELALSDFELLLAVNMNKKKADKLTIQSKKLREENRKGLSDKFNSDTAQIQKAIECN